jgi:hypothetical protein
MDDRSLHPHKIMATSIEFDLNDAFRLWREQLSQSPQFRTENLDELESHLRDSVGVLQSKGLSADEAFLIGTRRVGGVAALEREFAGENGGRGWRNFLRRLSYRYLDKVIHGLVLVYFTTGCWMLWGTMQIARMLIAMLSRRAGEGIPLPGFTQLALQLTPYWYLPPLVALVYCVFVWTRKPKGRSFWFGFFASTTALLVLLALPTLIAASLPLIDSLNRIPVPK